MKLLVDLFACQSSSRMRGIGRYTLSLTLEMARLRGWHDLTFLADALQADSFEELRRRFLGLVPAGSFLPYYHESILTAPRKDIGAYHRITENLIEQAYRVIDPDFVLTPSLFDSWVDDQEGRVALPDKRGPRQRRAVILYDLIPHIFHELYLDPSPPTRSWYMRRMELLKEFDLLLAISEATRQDAINIAGLDPDRVVNISGAPSSHFRKLDFSLAERHTWLRRLGISRPFVMYIGGNDFRKNMEGALRAFAGLPRELTSTHQLVLNDVGDEALFRLKAHALGLDDADLVIFRRRSDEELEVLYNLCKVFFFPSLYEGFGLPILEAMSCGAPVVAGDNSSLPEVVGRADALFDASRTEAATAALHKALTDSNFRADLTAYGPPRAREFTWEKTAQRAWEAFEAASDLPPLEPEQASDVAQPPRRLRLAHVSPLPPQKSGVAEYCASLLPHLAELLDIDLFAPPGLEVSDERLKDRFDIFPWTDLPARREEYDTVLYHMGNGELHIPMLDLLQQMPGVVVTHDFFSSNLPFVKEARTGEAGIFRRAMDRSHGLRGVVDFIKDGVESARLAWPLNWPLLTAAQELVIHSAHQQDLMRRFYRHGWLPRPTVIKQFRDAVPGTDPHRRRALREELDIPQDAFLFCSFGFVAYTKLSALILEAFAEALPRLDSQAMLVLVGELDEGSPFGKEILRLLRVPAVGERARVTGFVSDDCYVQYLDCADAAVQLRTESRGETSRAVLDCMAHALPTVINAHGSLTDYDPDCVVRLPETPTSSELADAMVRLATDADFREQKGRNARQTILRQHDPDIAAAAYAEVVRRAAEADEARLFAPLVDGLAGIGFPAPLMQSSAEFAAAHRSLRCQPRILLETTRLAVADPESSEGRLGIQFIKDLFASTDESVHLELVRIGEGGLLRAGRLAEVVFDVPRLSLGWDSPVDLRPGDVLVVGDPLMSEASVPADILRTLRGLGGSLVALADLPAGAASTSSIAQSDIVLCSSARAAEEAFASTLSREDGGSPAPRIFYAVRRGDSQLAELDVMSTTALEDGLEADGFDPAGVSEKIGWIMDLLDGRLFSPRPPVSGAGA